MEPIKTWKERREEWIAARPDVPEGPGGNEPFMHCEISDLRAALAAHMTPADKALSDAQYKKWTAMAVAAGFASITSAMESLAASRVPVAQEDDYTQEFTLDTIVNGLIYDSEREKHWRPALEEYIRVERNLAMSAAIASQSAEPVKPEDDGKANWTAAERLAFSIAGRESFDVVEVGVANLRALLDQAPVEYQYRMRGDWQIDEHWGEWTRCSAGSYGDYVKSPHIHNWLYETRKLFTEPPAAAVPAGWKLVPEKLTAKMAEALTFGRTQPAHNTYLNLLMSAPKYTATPVEAAPAPAVAVDDTMRRALEKIIEMNRQHAEDQYGDAKKAESWSCVIVAREALGAQSAPAAKPTLDAGIADHD
jgi:hypothetical protein